MQAPSDSLAGVLLAVDVGNTQTALGLYAGAELSDHWRLATERSTTADELGVLLSGLLDFDRVDGICLASTVPVLLREWESLADKWAHAPRPSGILWASPDQQAFVHHPVVSWGPGRGFLTEFDHHATSDPTREMPLIALVPAIRGVCKSGGTLSIT